MKITSSAFSAYAQAARSGEISRAGSDVVHSRKAVGLRLGKLGIRLETEETLDHASVAREAGDRLNRLRGFNFAESLQAQDAELYEALRTAPTSRAAEQPALESAFAAPNYTRNVGVRTYRRVSGFPQAHSSMINVRA